MPSWEVPARSPGRLPEAVGPTTAAAWLERFHSGDLAVIEQCYREHFLTVERAVGSILSGADRETAIHEVFARLIAGAELRQSFRGGSFGAWLATVARNHALDLRRRLVRERGALSGVERARPAEWEEASHARLLVERFRRERLPPEWIGVFELRFLEQLPQREAARRLSIRRTTLAYRELRIRKLLKQFLLSERPSSPSDKGTP